MIDSSGFTWRKSTFSGSSQNCVELGWRKSSFSGSSNNCVELARGEAWAAVRDSKNPDGAVLRLSAEGLRALVRAASR